MSLQLSVSWPEISSLQSQLYDCKDETSICGMTIVMIYI